MSPIARRAFLRTLAASSALPLLHACGGGGGGGGSLASSTQSGSCDGSGIPNAIAPVLPASDFTLPPLVNAALPRLRGAHLQEYATWTDPKYTGWIHLPEFPYWGGNVIRVFLTPYAQDGTPFLPRRPLTERIMAALATRQPIIDWCLANNVYVMLSFCTFLMWPVERNWPEWDDGRVLWTNSSAQQELEDLWAALASRFKGTPGVVFELFNEPQAHDPVSAKANEALPAGILNTLYPRYIKAIRSVDAGRAVVIAPEWSDVDALAALTYIDDPNLLYAVHPYVPSEFTQQGVNGIAAGSVTYPSSTNGWNKDWLRTQLQPARDYQLAHGARIIVSEFGVTRAAPANARLAYVTDMYSLFEEWGWDSVFFRYENRSYPSCYRQSWGLENSELEPLCQQIFAKNRVKRV